jgi:hypothetical protein
MDLACTAWGDAAHATSYVLTASWAQVEEGIWLISKECIVNCCVATVFLYGGPLGRVAMLCNRHAWAAAHLPLGFNDSLIDVTLGAGHVSRL